MAILVGTQSEIPKASNGSQAGSDYLAAAINQATSSTRHPEFIDGSNVNHAPNLAQLSVKTYILKTSIPFEWRQVTEFYKLRRTKHCCYALQSTFTSWVMASRASNHFTPNLSMHANTSKNVDARPICLPNGATTDVTHSGRTILHSSIELDDVLCVPNFIFNHFFISQLTMSLNCVVFFLLRYFVFSRNTSKESEWNG